MSQVLSRQIITIKNMFWAQCYKGHVKGQNARFFKIIAIKLYYARTRSYVIVLYSDTHKNGLVNFPINA